MKRRVVFLLWVVALWGCSGVNNQNTNVCEPNPCSETNRNLCVDEGGVARCLCNAGYLARPSGACEEVSAANCPEHSGDSAEPDDCSTRAKVVAAGEASRTQSIEPPGDYDFFTFSTTQGMIYEATVQAAGALMPRIDVFDQAGVWLDLAERVGAAALGFKAKTTSSHLLRVSHSPLDPSVGTGSYTFSLVTLGADDHGDESATATAIVATATGDAAPVYNGKLEISSDQDWFTFTGANTQNYLLSFDTAKGIPTVSLFGASSTTVPRWTAQEAAISFELPSNEVIYLRMTPATGQSGTYAFTLVRTPK